MKLKKLLSAYKVKLLGSHARLVRTKLIGREFLVYDGTIVEKVDKDDAWFFALSRHHDNIFDIGANIGYTTILASLTNAHKKVVLVDPNPDALTYASGNLIRNNLSVNKIFVPCFVSEKSGEKVKFFTVGAGAAGSMFASAAESARMSNSFYWVDTMTVDDIVNMTGVTPDFVKVDVEGAESFVLKGATRLAAMHQTKFFVEMHAPDEMPMLKNASLVLDWCKANNYTPYYLKEHSEMATAAMIAHRGKCHLLLVPQGQEYPSYLRNIQEGAALPTELL